MPTLKVRESTENISASRRVRDVDDTIHYLDPNEAPFVLLTKKAGKRTAINSKFEWIEKELPVRVTGCTNATTTATVTVTAGTGQNFFPFDLVFNPRTREIFRVVSVSTDTLTVDRGVGDIGATVNTATDDLIIIGNANLEGTTLGLERSVQESYLYNQTQIHRLPFGTTGSEQVSENYGGRDEPRLIRESGIWHMLQLEAAFLYGSRNLWTGTVTGASTNTPLRLSGGFEYFMETTAPAANRQDAGGTLTEPELETFCQTVFAATNAGQTRVAFCAPGVISVIDQLAAGRLQTVPSDKTYGIAVMQWLTSHGTLNLIKHRLLENGPNNTGRGERLLAVDPSKVMYVPLRERDTKLKMNVQAPGDDLWTHEYITECGFQINNVKAHGILKNVTS